MSTTTELIQEGKQLMEKLRFPEAEQRFKKALESDSRSADALVWLGRLALMKEQPQEGLRLLDEALRYAPNHAEALALKGIHHMKSEDYEKAIEFLEQAKASDPKLEMIYYNLGKSYREIGQFQKAEELVRKAIEMNPKQYQAYSELSYILGQTGRPTEGIKAMVEAIKINPLYLKGYLVLGELYKRGGKGDLAIQLYKEGLKHNPNALPLREALCNMYALKLDYRAAYAEALEVVKRRKNHHSDYLRLGNFAVALGEFEVAEKSYKTATQLEPNSWEGHYNLAELYMGANLKKEAKEHYLAAVERAGDNYKPFNGMGLYILHYEDNPGEARKYLTRALELAPTAVEPLFNMALASGKLRDFDVADKFANAVLRLVKPGDGLHRETERLLKALKQEKETPTN